MASIWFESQQDEQGGEQTIDQIRYRLIRWRSETPYSILVYRSAQSMGEKRISGNSRYYSNDIEKDTTLYILWTAHLRTLRNEFQERREPIVNATSRNSRFQEIPAMNGHFWNRTGLVRREFGDKLTHKCRLPARSKWSRVVTVVNHLWCQFSFIWSIFNFNRAHKIDLKIHFLITWLHSINHFSALWNNWKTTKQARSRVTMNWSIN